MAAFIPSSWTSAHNNLRGTLRGLIQENLPKAGPSPTLSLPSTNCVQNWVMPSAVMASLWGLYLVISSSRVIRRMAGHSSFFRPKNSRMRWLSSTSLSMNMKRIWKGEMNRLTPIAQIYPGRFQRAPTWPLKPSAAFLNWSILSWKSEAALGRNMRMWDLISPPKILGAVCISKRRHEDQSRTATTLP